MPETLATLAAISVPVFVVACMVAAGLGLSLTELTAPLRRGRLVLLSLAVNFLLAPAIALGLTILFALPTPFGNGLLLLGCAAGAPFLPKLAAAAKGDHAFSVGLMLILTLGSVLFLPLALPRLIPGVDAHPWPILKPLLVTMLLPLAAGMALKARRERLANRLRPIVSAISNLSMLMAIGALVALNGPAMLATFGTGAAAVGALFVLLSCLAGYALGGPRRDTRIVLALGTGQRNVAAVLLLATRNFPDPGVAVMLLVTTFAGLVVLLVVAKTPTKRPPIPSAPGGIVLV